MNAMAPLTTDLDGKPYSPATARPWLDAKSRADLARQFDCEPAQVEFSLDARDAMNAKIAERREYEDPYGYNRERF